MKYLLSLALLLIFSACSDTKEEQIQTAVKEVEKKPVATQNTSKIAPTSTPKEVKVPTPVKEEHIPEEVVVTEVSKPLPAKTAPTKTATAPKTIHPPLNREVVDAKALFNKCSACHGKNAEKSALGKSQIIRGWSSEKIASAIYGYQDGSYGGSMKAAMQGQVKGLSNAEVKALAAYISKL